ncbi:MAG TPA: DUF5916 domain-containing protein [Vicinamibacterales bacterium]|jgi:hypothetical protein|nr:DUF5916 domain-containing protein [Vicinamibacterales bacterium]
MPNRPRSHVLWLAIGLATTALATVGAPASTFAQPNPPELRARRVDVPPRIDGVLDDDAWSGAPLPLDTWVSYNPMRGQRASEQTKVWVAYDDHAIYFAFKCFDTQPDRIRTNISRRDDAFNDDWVGLSLDSSRAGQAAYHMFVNPSGIQMDAINSGSNGEDFAPDWVWQSAGHVDPDGYSVEIRLPLEAIRFRSGANVRMGILFWRRLSRMGVSWAWPEILPGKWVFETHVPLIFEELHQPRLLEVIPSATLSTKQSRATETAWSPRTSTGNLGASLKYGVTSTVTLEATGNPDFSQVESDAYQVEVNNRYPVFFSEKRPFFMEGLGLFNLAGTGGDSSMRTAVHTRRIVDPSAGLKMTGTAGRQSFAVLSAGDRSPGDGRQRLFTIGREVLNFGKGQYIGALVTDTEHGAEHNRVIGGDAAFRDGDHFTWNGSLLSSYSRSLDGPSTHGVASQGTYQYSTLRFNFSGQVEHYDRGFQMDTAFLNRVGFTRMWEYQEVSFYPTPSRYGWIKRIAPFFWISGAKDRVQGGGESYALPGIRFYFTKAAFIRLDYARGHETFAGRRFQIGQASASGNIQLTRWLSLSDSFSAGPATFYDPTQPFQGDKKTANVTVGFQPNAKLNHNLSYDFVTFNRRSSGDNVYRVHIVNLRNAYQFTPHFFLRAITQFDSSQRRVLGDFLASYELSPGTLAYAGYGTLFESGDTNTYRTTVRSFFFKVSYLARL